jgi:hypothetical protein
MSEQCISTHDPKLPVILPPECCPILVQNIPRRTDPGYTLPDPNICGVEEKPFGAELQK